MRRRQWTAGWSRIGEAEFKTIAAQAMGQDPGLYRRLRGAIVLSAARSGVERATRDRYVGWLGEAAQTPAI